MHYFKHPQDELLQDFCLFGDDFICHLFRQRQNALHPIAKARGQLVILALFLQQLNRLQLLLPPVCKWPARTSNVTLATPKTAFEIGLNYPVSIYYLFYVNVRELTLAKTAPYLIALSTDFSSGPLISGEYSSNTPSSS